jgi:uncharacterized membrane protein
MNVELEPSRSLLLTIIGYGLFGWSTEIVWTAFYELRSARKKDNPIDWSLAGKTYLWMLPIYGSAGLLFERVHSGLAGASLGWPVRGLVYMVGCFAVEFVTGAILKAVTRKIPWDYSSARWNVLGLIRLDYAPAWFAFGLVLERVEPFVYALSRVKLFA